MKIESTGEVRCKCGRLLCVYVLGVAQTKCRRCKQMVDLLAQPGCSVHCQCGRLAARASDQGVALMCPRCKRNFEMPLPSTTAS